jgi:hypothetical protein
MNSTRVSEEKQKNAGRKGKSKTAEAREKHKSSDF